MPAGWMAARHVDAGRRRRGGSGGGGNRYWSLRLGFTHSPVRVHFGMPDELYKDPDSELLLPWKKGERHYLPFMNNGKGGYLECLEESCLVCAHSNPQAYGFANVPADNDLAKQAPDTYYAIGGWIEEPFHLKDTQSKTDSNKTYKKKVLCEGRPCEHCDEGIPKVFGRRFYTTFSYSQWKWVIYPLMEEIDRSCTCGGYRFPTHYSCPSCNHRLMDMTESCPGCGSTDENDIQINADTHEAVCSACDERWYLLEALNKKLSEFAGSNYKCPNCNKANRPQVNLVCSEPGCEKDGHSIFDCRISFYKEGEGKQARLKVANWKIEDPDPRLFDAKFQGDDETAEKVAKSNHDSLPLSEIFQPEPPATQARLINRKDLFGNSGNENKEEEQQDSGNKTRYARYSKPD